METTEIKTEQHLEWVLSCKISDLEGIIADIDSHYRLKTEPKKDKRTGVPKPPKPDGSQQVRIMYPTKEESPLKKIQKLIVRRILSKIKLPTNIIGGVSRRDNLMHGKVHQGNKFKFVTDLKDFFPNITEQMVCKMFLRKGYSARVAHLLTMLTTYKNQLPQGAPTSNHVANLVFSKVDVHLIPFCQKKGIRYTRYVDDLFFSSKNDFREVGHEIIKMIQKGQFIINFGKTFFTAGNVYNMAGIKLGNNGISITADFRWKKEHTSTNSPKTLVGYNNYEERVLIYNRMKVRALVKFLQI